MTDAELRVVREYLGLTGEALAAILGVDNRTIRRWEAGTHEIPDGAREQIERIEAMAAEMVTRAVELSTQADTSADVSGLGAGNKMNLSDTTLNAGLAFEF